MSESHTVTNSQIAGIVQAATRAPSVHNTQPWRFVKTVSSAGPCIDVFAVPERALPVIDPNGRELHISVGAAIELAGIAAAGLGVGCLIELLPEPPVANRVARLQLRGQAVPDDHAVQLTKAIDMRYTERDQFDGEPISSEDIDRLTSCVSRDDVWVRILQRSSDQVSLAVLISHADDIERSDPAYDAELASWVRPLGPSPDGVPVEALRPALRASSLRLRDFSSDVPDGPAEYPEPPPPPEHPVVAVIGTPDDDTHAWLMAGMGLGRLLLEAALLGVSASPLTQVLEVPSTRAMAAEAVGALGHLQMVLRLGYASGKPTSGRLPLADVLTFA
jgi:hypothetical protein